MSTPLLAHPRERGDPGFCGERAVRVENLGSRFGGNERRWA